MKIGKNTYISPKAKIIDLNGHEIEDLIIGDNSYIGDDVQIICNSFHLGDYCKIHHHCNIHGKKIHIGHNAWIGQYTIIDGVGETIIGDNCGIGSHSQLWSHIKYGDTLEGCRFNYNKNLNIGKDVWFTGHCIVSPINAEDRSMALAGSVITKDMIKNHIYAGSPAIDITDKIGNQFIENNTNDKIKKMKNFLLEFGEVTSIVIVESVTDFKNDEKTYFAVKERQYTKKLTEEEILFMKFLLPEKAKFTPYICND